VGAVTLTARFPAQQAALRRFCAGRFSGCSRQRRGSARGAAVRGGWSMPEMSEAGTWYWLSRCSVRRSGWKVADQALDQLL
jgi:hypothetical protein